MSIHTSTGRHFPLSVSLYIHPRRVRQTFSSFCEFVCPSPTRQADILLFLRVCMAIHATLVRHSPLSASLYVHPHHAGQTLSTFFKSVCPFLAQTAYDNPIITGSYDHFRPRSEPSWFRHRPFPLPQRLLRSYQSHIHGKFRYR